GYRAQSLGSGDEEARAGAGNGLPVRIHDVTARGEGGTERRERGERDGGAGGPSDRGETHRFRTSPGRVPSISPASTRKQNGPLPLAFLGRRSSMWPRSGRGAPTSSRLKRIVLLK